jgi:hypothetical protein
LGLVKQLEDIRFVRERKTANYLMISKVGAWQTSGGYSYFKGEENSRLIHDF